MPASMVLPVWTTVVTATHVTVRPVSVPFTSWLVHSVSKSPQLSAHWMVCREREETAMPFASITENAVHLWTMNPSEFFRVHCRS